MVTVGSDIYIYIFKHFTVLSFISGCLGLNCIPCAQGERCGPTGGTLKKPPRRQSQAPENPQTWECTTHWRTQGQVGHLKDPREGKQSFWFLLCESKDCLHSGPLAFMTQRPLHPPKSLAPLPSAPQNAGPCRHRSVLGRKPWESPFLPSPFLSTL